MKTRFVVAGALVALALSASAFADVAGGNRVEGYANGLTIHTTIDNAGVPVTNADVTASGTITAAAQTVPIAVTSGMSAAAAQITGVWVGTISFEGTVDGYTWVPVNGVYAGASTPTTSITANGVIMLTPAGLTSIRLNATAWTSGTATITLRVGMGTGGTFINQSLTAGSNLIGKIGIDQTTPGTTDHVSAVLLPGSAVIGHTISDSGSTTAVTQPTAANLNATVVGTVTANAGTGTFAGSSAAQDPAFLAPASTTAPAKAPVIMGKTNDGTPQYQPIPLTAGGVSVKVDGSAATQPVSGTVTTAPPANASGNIAQVGGVAPPMGVIRVIQTDASQRPTGVPFNPLTVSGNVTVSGTVTVNEQAVTTGGCMVSRVATASTTNATSVKATVGQLYGWYVYNSNVAVRYLKLYNKSTAPTVGTDTPAMVLPIPPGSGANLGCDGAGISFPSGIAYATTTGVADSDTGVIVANDLVINLFYR